MDNVILEDPSKQRQRPKHPLQVLPIEIIRKQQDPNDAEQQKGVPSQGLDACNSDFAGSGLPFEKSTTDGDGDKGGQVHSSPESCESEPAHISRASVLELFSMSGEDHYSADEGSPSQRDSLFSSPEPEGSAIDSDSGVSFAAHKRGDDRIGGKAHQDIALVLEGDILHGEAENCMALHNEMLESNFSAPGLRIRPSKFGQEENDDVEPGKESDNSERGEGAHHITTAGGNCQLSENPRIIGGIQPYPLNGTRKNAQEIASPAFPLSGKRRRVTARVTISRFECLRRSGSLSGEDL